MHKIRKLNGFFGRIHTRVMEFFKNNEEWVASLVDKEITDEFLDALNVYVKEEEDYELDFDEVASLIKEWSALYPMQSSLAVKNEAKLSPNFILNAFKFLINIKMAINKGQLFHIDQETKHNENFRKVIYTGKMQLVLMSLQPGEEIGKEVHENVDQFFRIEQGEAHFVFENGSYSHFAKDGDAVVVPAGVYHNVVNESKTEHAKLYTIYTPPNHPPGTVQKFKSLESEPKAVVRIYHERETIEGSDEMQDFVHSGNIKIDNKDRSKFPSLKPDDIIEVEFRLCQGDSSQRDFIITMKKKEVLALVKRIVSGFYMNKHDDYIDVEMEVSAKNVDTKLLP